MDFDFPVDDAEVIEPEVIPPSAPEPPNQLVVIVQKSGLEPTKAQAILSQFSDYFAIAAEWERRAKEIVVTDASQVTDMKIAREGRLFLQKKRTALEAARKKLGDDALREKQTIDGIAKTLTGLIKPIETYLEQQEKFVEIQAAAEAERKRKEVEARMEQERIEAERKAEEERIAREKAEAKERERLRLENERLRQEAEQVRAKAEAERKKQEKILAEERRKAEEELRRVEDERRAEREEAERKQREIESQARQERDARDRVIAKQRRVEDEERETERKRHEAEIAEEKRKEAEAAAQLEAERKAREELERRLAAQVKCPRCGKVFIPGEKEEQTTLAL
jgi:hypothetical protein